MAIFSAGLWNHGGRCWNTLRGRPLHRASQLSSKVWSIRSGRSTFPCTSSLVSDKVAAAPIVGDDWTRAFVDNLVQNPIALENVTASVVAFAPSALPTEDAHSVAEVLIKARDIARERQEFAIADTLRSQLQASLGVHVEDHPGGKVSWRFASATHGHVPPRGGRGCLGQAMRAIAERALDVSLGATSVKEAAVEIDHCGDEILQLLSRASVEELPGRQPVDLAYKLALAGCRNTELFANLFDRATSELRRNKRRTRAVVVAQMIERCVSAGLRREDMPDLFDCAKAALQQQEFASATLSDLEAGNLSLFSERPMLWLRRHGLRLGHRRKPPPGELAAKAAVSELCRARKGPTPPLILDVGCGFGVSSLGLAELSDGHAILAVDVSAHCVLFASSMASRWAVPRARFNVVHCGALDAFAAVADGYDGQVEWILVNFPTPFAEPQDSDEASGNPHLPASKDSAEFMANRQFLAEARRCLLARNGAGGKGALLLQTQVEDLAITLRSMAEESGWAAVTDGSLGPEVPADATLEAVARDQWTPKRHLRHVSSGGARAAGPGWLASSPLPPKASTETERYYEVEGLPVHRVALRPI